MKLKIVHAGAISTGLVIVLGIAIIAPSLILPNIPRDQPVILSFEISNSYSLPQWCEDLAFLLDSNKIPAVVFFSGQIATQYPECVLAFSDDVDIGSMTMNYVILPEISDYLIQLDEVQQGKDAVDKAGNLDSKLFKAPAGITDENIYSLLSRSDILADFSYDEQYNKFDGNSFIKHDLIVYDNHSDPIKIIPHTTHNDAIPTPIMVTFSDSVSIQYVEKYIDSLSKSNVSFVNPSTVLQIKLTERG